MQKSIIVLVLWVFSSYAIGASAIVPTSLSFGMDQHGSFNVNELQSSPLLKGLFGLSVEELGNNLARVCIEPQHSCKVVTKTEDVDVVNSNGLVKFVK